MSKAKRVILVANSTWNIYNFRLNVINHLLQEGHEIVVIAPIDEYLEYKEKYPMVRHIALKTLDRDSTNPIKDLVLILELYRKYKWLKPDLILHYTNKPNIYGAIASKILGLKSVAVVTGLGYSFIRKGLLNRIVRSLYRVSGKYHARFIFENEDDKKLFIEEKITKQENAYSIKGCGVDTNYYAPYPNGQVRNDTTFTFIGRLLHDKGINEFIAAADSIKSKHPNTKFVVIGEFDHKNPSSIDRESLAKWVDRGVIDYKGFVKDIRPLIAQSDCIVLPSYREGMPRTLLEGMAMGKPLIASDVPGCRETIVEGMNGFLTKVQSADALTNTIEDFLLLSYDERKKLGEKGREMSIDTYNDKLIAEQIYQIVKPVMYAV